MGAIFLKTVYSALLIGGAGIMLRELWTVWRDPRVYIGRFEVTSDAGTDEAAGTAFAKRIVGAQAVLSRQVADYQSRSGVYAATDATYRLPGLEPLELPKEALEGVDITIQNVNVRQILTAIRKGFRAPNEVRGHVTRREGSVLTAVDWPRAPRLRGADSSVNMTFFLTPSRRNDEGAAAYVACSLSWARAASRDSSRVRRGARSVLREIFQRVDTQADSGGPASTYSREQFCDFATSLGDLYALGSKASEPGGISVEETALVRARAAQLRSYYGSSPFFPEIYRLRADLLDLIPEAARGQTELVEAQEDRVRYAMLTPALRKLPEETRRLVALAMARPSLLFGADGSLKPPTNWSRLLARHDEAIRAAALSTGLVIGHDGAPKGTGFIVGPDLVMTARHVLMGQSVSDTQRAPRETAMQLCLGLTASNCESKLTIGAIVFNEPKSLVVIARLEGHDAVRHPPLPLSPPLPDANALTGRYAYVIGYPFLDHRMPEQFIEELLQKIAGRKRLMPGRILAFGRDVNAGGDPEFTTDISTTNGTAGGPLVDLGTGAVLGVSYAGKWAGERGKFAYAESVPDSARKLIEQESRGQRNPPPLDSQSSVSK